MDVIVVGAGVIGLSCAIRLARGGHRVRVWTKALPPATTSAVAAAIWYPYRVHADALRWAEVTLVELRRRAAVPDSGILLRRGRDLFRSKVELPPWAELVGLRRLRADELPDGYGGGDGFAFEAPVVEMPLYLAHLARELDELGIPLEVHPVVTLDEPLVHAATVVNCSGLGARELAPDPTVVPVRGQVLRVRCPRVERFLFDDHGPGGVTYIVPRHDDVVLGGSWEEGNTSTVPDPATRAAILSRCIALEPELHNATVVGEKVGLRPGRPSVRLDAERRGRGKVVHCYGHAGAGVTLSWGCAAAVAALI